MSSLLPEPTGATPGAASRSNPLVLRVMGAVDMLTGVVLVALGAPGLLDLASGGAGFDPGEHWMLLVGAPLILLGGGVFWLGSRLSRAASTPTGSAPAATDTDRLCRTCATRNDRDARYCDNCGSPLEAT